MGSWVWQGRDKNEAVYGMRLSRRKGTAMGRWKPMRRKPLPILVLAGLMMSGQVVLDAAIKPGMQLPHGRRPARTWRPLPPHHAASGAIRAAYLLLE